jgi:restriction endonuclease Mrr
MSNIDTTTNTHKFTVYWLDGKRTLHPANDGEIIADVFNRTGYGAGSVAAIDFYTSGDDHNYIWNGKTWALKEQR